MENIHWGQGYDLRYPDMALYQEILLLQHRFEGLYCIENVISYYKPLIPPKEIDSHYYWTNIDVRNPQIKNSRKINTGFRNFGNEREEMIGIDLTKYNITKSLREKIVNNCVEPEIGAYILNCARNSFPPIQDGLFAENDSKNSA
jgi:DNA (cytosine-5)-methyltransferase 1